MKSSDLVLLLTARVMSGKSSLSGGWGQPPPTSVGRTLTRTDSYIHVYIIIIVRSTIFMQGLLPTCISILVHVGPLSFVFVEGSLYHVRHVQVPSLFGKHVHNAGWSIHVTSWLVRKPNNAACA